jgi:chromosome segregation ATPase
MEKIRTENLQMVSDIRENYHKETQRMKQFSDKEIADTKLLENSEKTRIRDDYQERIQEKLEEIKQLRQEKESLLMKNEKFAQELEFTKLDLKEKTFQLETKQSSLESRENDIHGLKENIYDLNEKLVELQESLKQENYEKLNLISVRETLTHEMNILKKENISLDAEVAILKLENSKLIYETTDLHSKKETVEVVSRENEKYKIHRETLLSKIQELEYKIINLNKEHEFASQESRRILSEKQSLSHELNKLQENFTQSQSLLTETKENFIKEKEKNTYLESKNLDLKSSCTQITSENENLKQTTEEKDREMSLLHEEWERKWSSMISIYILMNSALSDWDESLITLVDGHQNHHRQQPTHRYPIHPGDTFESTIGKGRNLNNFFGTPMKGTGAVNNNHMNNMMFSGTAKSRSFSQLPTSVKATSTSPTSRKQQQQLNKSHALLAFDQDYYSNLLSSSYLELHAKQDIAILIERISLKFDRIVQVRSSFTQEASQLVQTFTQFQEKIASKLTSSDQQIVLLQSELSHLQKTLQHSREVSYQEKQEFSSMKERLVHDHQKNYKELDMKHQEILIKYETMKLQDEYHQQQIQTFHSEKLDLQKQVHQLMKEKEVIPILEMKNNELNGKALELSRQINALDQVNAFNIFL